MQIDIVTLFPEMFRGPFDESIIKRAQDKSLVKINIHYLRKWAIDKRGSVDDKPYGGGVGMVIRVEPFFNAVADIKKNLNGKTKVILLSASGTPHNQKKAKQYSKLDNLIIICGHYEGVDQRVADFLVNEEISVGDYVLTGGEIPAIVIVDTVVRLIPGVLEKPEATQFESFSKNILEYPQYTRPEDFKGYKVPKILLSGNHKEIEDWKKQQALEKTKKIRPDLL